MRTAFAIGLLLCATGILMPLRAWSLEADAAGATVDLDEGLGPVPVIKANSLFRIPDGEKEWNAAYEKATLPLDQLGVQPRLMGDMLQDGFRRVTNFRSEVYARDRQSCDLTLVVSAQEAWVEKANPKLVQLKGLRIVFFVTSGVLNAANAQAKAQGKAPVGGAHPGVTSLPAALNRSRFVIRAERGTIDLNSGEGVAYKDDEGKPQVVSAPKPDSELQENEGVHIEIFSMATDQQATEPMGELSCPGLRWRAWSDPRNGTSDIALCAIAKDEPDPIVRGRFVSRNPETQEQSEMKILAMGMVFLTSVQDHMRPVTDDEGKTIGVTNVLQRRVLFHKEIGMRIDGNGAAPLIPFQAPAASTEKTPAKPKDPTKGPAKSPEPPSRTVVICKGGPAVLDLAVPPRTLPPGPPDRVAPLATRFEFLNGVSLNRTPLASPTANAAPGNTTQLQCRHLCFQFAAAAPTGLPEYAEAMGGVVMKGTRTVSETAATTPFRIDCQRVYYDGASDATVLQGVEGGSRVEIVDEMGELYTQSCVISRPTQMLYMPHPGPKNAIVRGTRKAVPEVKPEVKPDANAALDFGGGDLSAEWLGTFRREIVPVLGPGNVETLKEILILDKDVKLEQPQKGMRIEGQHIRIVRNATTGQVERLEGRGGVLVRSGDMQVKGELVTANLRYSDKGEVIQNTIVVWSPPESHKFAYLWQEESAVRGERFVIDALNNNFQAYGGVVARFNLPQSDEKKGAEAAGGAALIPGFSTGGGSGKPGSNRLALQCDGDFEFDGSSGQLRVTRNVLISQEGLRIVSDGMLLTLAPPVQEEKKDVRGKDARDPKKGKDDKKDAEKKDTGLFSASVKSIECRGRVEITTPTQVVHSDHLLYDMASMQVFLEMEDPKEKVRVYLQDASGSTKLLEVTRRLDYNTKDGIFTPAERMILKPYERDVPLPRKAAEPTQQGGAK